MRKFLLRIYKFFYYKTPKGKEELYWEKATISLEKALLIKGNNELRVKSKCISFAKKVSLKKRLSNFHLAKITAEKYKDELKDNGLDIDPKSLRFKSA